MPKGRLHAVAADPLLLSPFAKSQSTHSRTVKPSLALTETGMQGRSRTGSARLLAPIFEYNWLGTDDQGRDVVAASRSGFRISVLFGLALTLISSVIGVAAGAVQGYFGGSTGVFFQRLVDLDAIPALYLLLIISSVLVPRLLRAAPIFCCSLRVSLVGLVRAEFLRGRNWSGAAARALGVSDRTIMSGICCPTPWSPP